MNSKTRQDPKREVEQQLASPAGKVVGFFHDQAKLAAFAKSAAAENISQSGIKILEGEEGIRLLKGLKKSEFFFGDAEDHMLERAVRELAQGHIATIIEVADRDQALHVAKLAQLQDGFDFTHFGTWVNEQLPT